MAEGGGPTILQNDFVVYILLPFLLVFTLVFAILQKSQILGKGKSRNDAIVALVIGLMVVAFGYPTGIIVRLVPWLGVGVVILLVFLLLWAAVYKEGEFSVPANVQKWLGVLIFIGVVIAVLMVSGKWDDLFNLATANSTTLYTIIFVILIALGIVVVVYEKKDKK